MEVRIDEVVKCKQDVEDLGIANGDYIFIEPKQLLQKVVILNHALLMIKEV